MADDRDFPPTLGLERAASVALRTLHLVAVVALGAAMLGAPLGPGGPGLAVVASGLVLFALDLRAGRLALAELAGIVVGLKLAGSAWIAAGGAHAGAVFWAMVVLSSLSSHAPRALRHWRLWRWPVGARHRDAE